MKKLLLLVTSIIVSITIDAQIVNVYTKDSAYVATHDLASKSFQFRYENGELWNGTTSDVSYSAADGYIFQFKKQNILGSGTQADPYIISDAADLAKLPAWVAESDAHARAYYKQTADINCHGTKVTPIGTTNRPFRGNYDGAGHTISYMDYDSHVEYINHDNNTVYATALFGIIKTATIHDLTISMPTFHMPGNTDKISISPFVAKAYGNGSTPCTIYNCSTTERNVQYNLTAEDQGGSNAPQGLTFGGIIADSQSYLDIHDCYNYIDFASYPTTAYYRNSTRIGGIVGYVQGVNSDFDDDLDDNAIVKIYNCRNKGFLAVRIPQQTIGSGLILGGIIGEAIDYNNDKDVCCYVYNCVNTGTLNGCMDAYTASSGAVGYVGGIIGKHDSDGYSGGNDPIFTNCINRGYIYTSGRIHIAGIMGYCYDDDTSISLSANFGNITTQKNENTPAAICGNSEGVLGMCWQCNSSQSSLKIGGGSQTSCGSTKSCSEIVTYMNNFIGVAPAGLYSKWVYYSSDSHCDLEFSDYQGSGSPWQPAYTGTDAIYATVSGPGLTYKLGLEPTVSYTTDSNSKRYVNITYRGKTTPELTEEVLSGQPTNHLDITLSTYTAPLDYLCFTTSEASTTVGMCKSTGYEWTKTVPSLEYSTDKVNWKTVTYGSPIVLDNAGDKIYYKAASTNTTFSEDCNRYIYFTADKPVNASGNIMSLLDASCQQTTLPAYAFNHLFFDYNNAGKLTVAPELPMTTLSEGCYEDMFQGCSLLTTAPELPATTLAKDCYNNMFNGCTRLNKVSVKFTSWTAGTDSCTVNWLKGVANTGTLSCPVALSLSKRSTSTVPTGWTAGVPDFLCFTAKEANASVSLSVNGTLTTTPTLQYSTNKENWTNYTFGTSVSLANIDDKVYFKATTENSTFSQDDNNYIQFTSTANVASSGNIMSLLDQTCSSTTMPAHAFSHLFKDCTYLTVAPALPATTLATGCYNNMFEGCSNINKVAVSFTSWTAGTDSCTVNWLKGVASTGTLVCPNTLDVTTKISNSTVPTGWSKVTDYLCFIAQDVDIQIGFKKVGENGNPAIQYSTDMVNWTNYTFGTNINLSNIGDKVYFKAITSNTNFSDDLYKYIQFTSTGRVAASGNIMSLLDETCKSTTVPSNAFNHLFYNCTGLTTAPKLPATTLGGLCYEYMFYGCNSLTAAPELPSTTLQQYCYAHMFEGCTGLTAAPELPATTLQQYCYSNMFVNCTGLTVAPKLIAADLQSGCYENMFNGCTKLAKVYINFTDWNPSNVTNATTYWLNGVAYNGSFVCPNALNTSSRGSSTIPQGWTVNPDYLCFKAGSAAATVNFTQVGDMTETNKPTLQYSKDRFSWTDYTIGSDITLTTGDSVFFKATSTNAAFYEDYTKYIKFTSTANVAASGNIMSLLDNKLYSNIVPANAFNRLFSGCTGLTTAPELPATELNDSCYNYMFSGCTGLTIAPELPATTLAKGCYKGIFNGCTALMEAPELPASTLVEDCYKNMFNGCSHLNKVSVSFTSWNIPNTSTMCTVDWLKDVASTGKFISPNELDVATKSSSTVPDGWTVDRDFLCFKAGTSGATIKFFKVGNNMTSQPSLQYSSDKFNWTNYSLGDDITLSANDSVFFKASSTNSAFYDTNYFSYIKFTSTANVAASGNIISLLDGTCKSTTIPANAFNRLFSGCDKLTVAPELPMTTLADSCYNYMFSGCTGLTAAPKLYATTLAKSCYKGMFSGCIGFTKAPELPVTTLADSCYNYMFYGCTGLTEAPELPATALAAGCYKGMFSGCTNLTIVPTLPASTLVNNCYEDMFNGCTSLNKVSVNFTMWNPENVSNATTNWLSNVASTGTFTYPMGLDVTTTRDGSHVPSGWTLDCITPAIILNAYGYATFSNDHDVQVVSGCNAYTVKCDGSTLRCTRITDNKIPAYTGVLLFGEAYTNITFNYIDNATALANNQLKPTTTSNGLAAKEESFTLDGNTFKKFTGTAYNANKAYLPKSAYPENARTISIVFSDDETTGITETLDSRIKTNDSIYNLSGQRLREPQKGQINIINGKKVYLK